jgi:hypothetical protein
VQDKLQENRLPTNHLRCPDCNSADMKKVSLAWQEGQFHVNTRTRLRAFLFGNDGPSLIVGRAVTQGVHWTQLSKLLSPPRKWSYVRLNFWATIITFIALGGYIVFVASSPPPVSTVPMKIYAFLAPVVLLILVFVFWRHNHVKFPQEYAQWNRSFICQRCGVVSLHDVPRSSLPLA